MNRRTVLKASAAGTAAAVAAKMGGPVISAQAQGATPSPVAGPQQYAYVGADSRTAIKNGIDPSQAGISVFSVDPGTGDLSHIQTLESDNPFFFAFDSTQRFLYAVNVIGDYEGKESGSVEAYEIDAATGKLTFLNRQSSEGSTAADLAVDPSGKFLVVANYNGDNVVVLPINDNGALEPVVSKVERTGSGPNKARQEGPHPHCAIYDPAGKYVAIADLGTDNVITYQLDLSTGKLNQVSEASTAPGDGPRHIAFNADGTLMYVVGEMGATITTFAYDPDTGAIGDIKQTISTVPDPFVGTRSTAEILMHPSGKFLYNSNRGQPDSSTLEGNAIVGFTVAQDTGMLSLIGYATDFIAEPWSFDFNAGGTFLYAANHLGDSITRFAIDPDTGALARSGDPFFTPAPFVIMMSTPR
ncbi:MAG TPA: lactonase family protein [Thermomicrobiales bacterium]|nr:lactonase family protein [Thermomicrobiales bacterium]